MTNPGYISRNHPVRVILDQAAHGNQPSKRDLDQLLIEVSDENLPDGQSLDRYRTELVKHASRIAGIHATGATGPARTAAEEAASTLASQMTTEQRALNTSATRSSDQDVDDVVRRVFEN